MDDLHPVMQMMTTLSIRAANGQRIEAEISHSIHALPERPGEPFVARYE